MKTHFLRLKFKKKKSLIFFFTGPTDTANFNQVLTKHLDDIVFYNLTFFGANMSCEHEKRKKTVKAFEKNSILSQKTVKKPVFLRFF
jgi:hypothetical protein